MEQDSQQTSKNLAATNATPIAAAEHMLFYQRRNTTRQFLPIYRDFVIDLSL